LKKEVNFKS